MKNNEVDKAWQASEVFRLDVCEALGIPYEVEGIVVDGMETDAIKSIQALKTRIEELEKTEELYKMLRKDHAAMTERIDTAWHAVCGTTMEAPQALARLLEIIDGQHGDADPHMAAINVLAAKRIDR